MTALLFLVTHHRDNTTTLQARRREWGVIAARLRRSDREASIALLPYLRDAGVGEPEITLRLRLPRELAQQCAEAAGVHI